MKKVALLSNALKMLNDDVVRLVKTFFAKLEEVSIQPFCRCLSNYFLITIRKASAKGLNRDFFQDDK
jgi:hypothetical protein